jgi:hypothetical protein
MDTVYAESASEEYSQLLLVFLRQLNSVDILKRLRLLTRIPLRLLLTGRVKRVLVGGSLAANHHWVASIWPSSPARPETILNLN